MSIVLWSRDLRAQFSARARRQSPPIARSINPARDRPGGGRARKLIPTLDDLEDRIVLTATETAVFSSPNPSILGQAVTFTASVETDVVGVVNVPVSQGTVQFTIGGVNYGPESLNGDGIATFVDSTLSPGSYTVFDTYSGTSLYSGTSATENGNQIVEAAPAITSAPTALFTTGVAGNFTVTAAGFPVPTLSESSATSLAGLGLSFNATTGVLSGTPLPGTGGTYGLLFTASNGIGSNVTQDFSLTINQPPTITSLDNTTFTLSQRGTFTVSAAGNPTPTLTESGTLPNGVSFNATTDLLGGTPTATPGGVYTITFTATNGIGSSATQTFFLVVNVPPAITSPSNTTFVVGIPGAFTVTDTGSPAPTLSESGPLPAGVTFDPDDGRLSGTPAANDGGAYAITLTATNGVGPPATQSFVLLVNQPPAITSADSTVFAEGTPGTFTVTTQGSPQPTLSESGTLPVGVSFDSRTGILSGTPPANAVGSYPITFTATNGVGSAATQTFYFSVDFASDVLAAPTNFVVTSVTATSIAIGWTDNDPRATSYAVWQAAAGSMNFAPLAGSPFGSGTTSAIADGLTIGIAYQFEVRASTTTASSNWLVSAPINTLQSTSTSLSANPDPLILATPESNSDDQANDAILTATVTNTGSSTEVPTGSVTFFDVTDNVVIGSATLDQNGQASIDATSLIEGIYDYTATYVPTTNFAPSTGSLTELVQAATVLSITAGQALGPLGQPITFTAGVDNNDDNNNATPTGSVDFVDDTTSPSINLGTVPLVGGVATLTTTFLTTGTHNIVATYIPTGNFASSLDFLNEPVDATDTWINPAGGDWDDPGNWSNGVPTSDVDVNISTLEANNPIILGSADVANHLTIFNGVTFSGGQLTVAASFTDSAPLLLASGAVLVVSGSFTLQDVTISQNAMLSGTGLVAGNLVNSGELDMGASVGIIVVTGTYTQAPGATLTVKIGGSLASDADQLSVLGAAKLSGTLSANVIDGFLPTPTLTLTVVKLASPATGDFSSVAAPSIGGVIELYPIINLGGIGFGGSQASIASPGDPVWQPEGPSPISNSQDVSAPDNGAVGAISSVVVVPNTNIVYVGTVDGGVWESDVVTPGFIANLSQAEPAFNSQTVWTPLTDQEPSLAVSTLALDPTDPTGNTLWVGTGSVSSATISTIPPGLTLSGTAIGLLKTTNGGDSWADLAGSPGAAISAISGIGPGPIVFTTTSTAGLIAGSELSITNVVGNLNGTWTVASVTPDSFTINDYGTATYTASPKASWISSIRGDVILAVVPTATTDPTTGKQVILVGTEGQGIFRSTDGGANFAPVTYLLSNGISTTNLGAFNPFTRVAAGAIVRSIVTDPSNPSVFYASVDGVGIFASYNDGANWIEIDNSIPQIKSVPFYTLAVAPDPTNNDTLLYVATATTSSLNGGAAFAGLVVALVSPIPLGPVTWIPLGANNVPSAQINGDALDPFGHFYVVVSPSSPWTVYVGGMLQLLYQGLVVPDTANPSGSFVVWSPLSNGNGQPHDDQRDIAFLSDGTILATCDGGIYALAPNSGVKWVDVNANIQNTEFFQIAYDTNENLIVGGSQDNGTPIQVAGLPAWGTLNAPDGTLLGIVNGGRNFVGSGDGGAVAVDPLNGYAMIYLTSDGHLRWYYTGGGSNVDETGALPLANGDLTPTLNAQDEQTYLNSEGTDASYLIAANQSGPGGILLGMSGVYLFNPAGTGLPDDDGTGVSILSTPFMTGSVTALAGYNANGDAYFGTSTGQIFMSTTFGQFFMVNAPTAWFTKGKPNGLNAIQIIGDPNNANTIFVLANNGQLWGVQNAVTGNWINITGNLGGLLNTRNGNNTETSL